MLVAGVLAAAVAGLFVVDAAGDWVGEEWLLEASLHWQRVA